jgi:uncharacterized membrane protein
LTATYNYRYSFCLISERLSKANNGRGSKNISIYHSCLATTLSLSYPFLLFFFFFLLVPRHFYYSLLGKLVKHSPKL